MFSTHTRYGILMAVFLFELTAAQGQTNRGVIAGSVLDASGAAVPEATVKLEQQATGFSRTLNTPASGDFTFSDLSPGVYMVTISHSGFQRQRIDKVEV